MVPKPWKNWSKCYLGRFVTTRLMSFIDPELRIAVKKLRNDSRDLQALVTLERASVQGKEPFEVTAVVNSLVRETAADCHLEPTRVVIFNNINSFAIEAPARFLDRLLKSRRVGSATLNEA